MRLTAIRINRSTCRLMGLRFVGSMQVLSGRAEPTQPPNDAHCITGPSRVSTGSTLDGAADGEPLDQIGQTADTACRAGDRTEIVNRRPNSLIVHHLLELFAQLG